VPEPEVGKFVDRLHQQKGIKIDYRVVEGANHFFHGYTDLVINHVNDHLDKVDAVKAKMITDKQQRLIAAE